MLTAATKTDEIAQAFVDARKTGRALPDYPGPMPTDMATAYNIQDAAISGFAGQVCGWKVGRINAPRDAELGTTRLFGPAWANQLDHLSKGSPATGRIFEGGFGAAEAEFMFRIGTAPPSGQANFTTEEVTDLIDAVFIGFEIASSPFPGINEKGPLVTISDFGNNNGLLLGPEIPDWRTSDLINWQVETRIDGKVVGAGQASAFPGGPIESVRLLLENLAARGYPVEVGMLVSTGAVSGVHVVTAGQQVESRFGDFGTISCAIGYAGA